MYARRDRLQQLFRDEIALAIRGVKDPGLKGFLTITDLELSADGKSARVYYSILGTAQERKAADQALKRAAPYLRQVLRKRLSMKIVPQFDFLFDDTPRKASIIDKMLLKIEQEKSSGESE